MTVKPIDSKMRGHASAVGLVLAAAGGVTARLAGAADGVGAACAVSTDNAPVAEAVLAAKHTATMGASTAMQRRLKKAALVVVLTGAILTAV